MNLRFLVARNVLAQLAGKGITAGTTFIITILLARQYGAVGYGDFTKMVAFISVFYLLIDFGMNAVFVRKVNENKYDANGLFSSLLLLRTVGAFVLVFIALSILAFLPYDPATNEGFSPLVRLGIIILAPTILTQGFITSFNALFQNALRYDKATIAVGAGSFLTLALVYLFVASTMPLPVVVSAFVAGGVMSVATSYLLSKSHVSHINYFRVKSSTARALLISSLPLGITLLFNTIHFRTDIFVLTMTRPTVEVGIYGLATKFFEFPLTLPTFFMNAVYPLLLKSLHSNDAARWQRMVRESALFLTVISLLIAVAGFLLAPLLSYIKEDFVSSVLPFRILVFTLPLFFLSSLFMWILIAQGKTWRLVWIYGIAMMVNVVLNILFIPRFGYVAAAIVTGVSEGVVLLLLGLNMRGVAGLSSEA